jgi:hypothetical protein
MVFSERLAVVLGIVDVDDSKVWEGMRKKLDWGD